MSAHTLTPWFISDHNRTKIVVTIKGNDLFWVVAETGFGPAVMAEANAAYIVTCVNSHAQLLAERDALRAERDEHNAAYASQMREINALKATTAKLRERNEALLQALADVTQASTLEQAEDIAGAAILKYDDSVILVKP